MASIIGSFLVSLAASVALTPLIRRFALHRGLVDAIDPRRKIHSVPIPRLGGVAIVVAFFVPIVVRSLIFGPLHLALPNQRLRAAAILVGGLVIALLGVIDDLRGTDARAKLGVQFVVATALYAAGVRIGALSLPFVAPIELGLLGLPLTVLWIVGVTNAMNLIDGLDGLAGGVAAIAIASIFAFSFFRAELFAMGISASLGGAVLGFLVYNFNPARIFMGDTGSMFLGFILASSALVSGQHSPSSVSLIVPVVVLGLPIGDTLITIYRRVRAHRPIFAADRNHIHHRLLGGGLGHRAAVLVLYGVCLLLGVAAQLLWVSDGISSVALLAFLVLIAVLSLRKLTRAVLAHSPPSASLRTTPERALVMARVAAARARTNEELWVALRDSARLAGAVGLGVNLPDKGQSAYAATFATASSTTMSRATGSALALVAEWPRGGETAPLLYQDWIERLTVYADEAAERINQVHELADDVPTVRLIEAAPRF